ncbi:protein phosphatase CheZ [Marichromatium gracile]|uniref:protein phosphatase CheZ n=1 Tax=Marichromatium gracile TaxID=1048 RepID=UPI001F1C1D76|nr:protein phosphatase CheZ [Marichromatium gracile]MCF1184224.1 protein phosphatase CheZ [Marichromatium gracile]
MAEPQNIDKNIASLVKATESILNGEYERLDIDIDAEGMLSVLAQKINALVVNMKSAETPLTNAGEQAPNAVSHARNVIELMSQSTGQVLDNADRLSQEIESLEGQLQGDTASAPEYEQRLSQIKHHLFDIVASQSYQDVARQRMEQLVEDLDQIRDWLVEVLVILNIQQNSSIENVEQKAQLLREVNGSSTPEALKQDLVDDLLSEFGF